MEHLKLLFPICVNVFQLNFYFCLRSEKELGQSLIFSPLKPPKSLFGE